MHDLYNSFIEAIHLIFNMDDALLEIINLSFYVSLSAVFISMFIGFPIGAWLAIHQFKGRVFILTIFNTLMGFPPVVAGLFVYLFLSRSGPLGVLEILYTPTAMIIVQIILVTPIIVSISAQSLEDLYNEYKEQLYIMHINGIHKILLLLREGRYSLITALLAGFGRATAEVGGVIIVGGNINHITRVMTTSIHLETSKGNLSYALSLGIILLFISLSINIILNIVKKGAKSFQ